MCCAVCCVCTTREAQLASWVSQQKLPGLQEKNNLVWRSWECLLLSPEKDLRCRDSFIEQAITETHSAVSERQKHNNVFQRRSINTRQINLSVVVSISLIALVRLCFQSRVSVIVCQEKKYQTNVENSSAHPVEQKLEPRATKSSSD